MTSMFKPMAFTTWEKKNQIKAVIERQDIRAVVVQSEIEYITRDDRTGLAISAPYYDVFTLNGPYQRFMGQGAALFVAACLNGQLKKEGLYRD